MKQPPLAKHMMERKKGSIVNISSVAGIRSGGGANAYSASKAAIINFTMTSACDLGGYNVRVNAVCPGIIRTPMALAAVGNDHAYLEGVGRKAHPLGRVGEPEEGAKLVCFLASDDSSFIRCCDPV